LSVGRRSCLTVMTGRLSKKFSSILVDGKGGSVGRKEVESDTVPKLMKTGAKLEERTEFPEFLYQSRRRTVLLLQFAQDMPYRRLLQPEGVQDAKIRPIRVFLQGKHTTKGKDTKEGDKNDDSL